MRLAHPDVPERAEEVKLWLVVALACLAWTAPGSGETERARRLSRIPDTVLWAWERPEDLRALAEAKGVAFLAQTITLGPDAPLLYTRRQPLYVPDTSPLIAVTRIESPRPKRVTVTDHETRVIVDAIVMSAGLPRVVAVQIDFDAVESQRPLYLDLLRRVRGALPDHTPLSMTALASWCAGDRWLHDAPVDEIVPMLFRMGPATEALKQVATSIESVDARCRAAVGTSLDEPLRIVRQHRRVYAFSATAWTRQSLDAIDVVEP
jgi:hypothetical protein